MNCVLQEMDNSCSILMESVKRYRKIKINILVLYYRTNHTKHVEYKLIICTAQK